MATDVWKLLSPSGWYVVCVGRFGADLSGQSKICYFDQFWTHAQQILRLHISMEEAWTTVNNTLLANWDYIHNDSVEAFYTSEKFRKDLKIEE